MQHRPITLIILDGWGYREEKSFNAIATANTPIWDAAWKQYPHTLISGSGHSVGLPKGQMGNSEVGHLHMGAGRWVEQDLSRIHHHIEDGTFFKNSVLSSAIEATLKSQASLHIIGLLSEGGVHSHENHFHALLEMAAKQGIKNIYIHAFLDGRDTPPRSALTSIQKIENKCQTLQCGQLVSFIGRYYAMDRDHRWERIQKAYDLLTLGTSEIQAQTASDGLKKAYELGYTDEFVPPTTVGDPINIQDNDSIIFMNFRSDRARELTDAFVTPIFKGFNRKAHPTLNHFVTLTEYDKTFPVKVAYPSLPLNNMLSEYISHVGLKQLRIAETEKYAHVTFFFNGGREEALPGEDRVLIPSPKVATYNLKPEMSAYLITERLVKEIKNKNFDMIICNFANPDMVGHTGDFNATVKAIEVIDECLGQLIQALHAVGGEAIITADHGNAEYMFDLNTQQPHTAHTSERVPFLYIGRQATITSHDGQLSDIAPTILHLMSLEKPIEMTGKSLLRLD